MLTGTLQVEVIRTSEHSVHQQSAFILLQNSRIVTLLVSEYSIPGCVYGRSTGRKNYLIQPQIFFSHVNLAVPPLIKCFKEYSFI